MTAMRLYFRDHAPIKVEGCPIDLTIQLMNAKRHPGFFAWEPLPEETK